MTSWKILLQLVDLQRSRDDSIRNILITIISYHLPKGSQKNTWYIILAFRYATVFREEQEFVDQYDPSLHDITSEVNSRNLSTN